MQTFLELVENTRTDVEHIEFKSFSKYTNMPNSMVKIPYNYELKLFGFLLGSHGILEIASGQPIAAN